MINPFNIFIRNPNVYDFNFVIGVCLNSMIMAGKYVTVRINANITPAAVIIPNCLTISMFDLIKEANPILVVMEVRKIAVPIFSIV